MTQARLEDREGPIIDRPRLLARLQAAEGSRVVVLTAPPGSGKTTLLRQWAANDLRPACWVPLADGAADTETLVRRIADAISASLSGGPVGGLRTATGANGDAAVASLIRAISLDRRPLLLLLDDLHGLDDPGAYRLVATLAEALPSTWSLGLAGREVVSLPTGRWRLRGSVVELGLTELAFDEHECGQILALHAIDPSPELVADVHARTEGWAAGVRLAALALAGGAPAPDRAPVAGDVDSIRSYLETELLAGLDPATHGLLVQTSVLSSVCGPLADAVTGRSGSAARLYQASRANQMVIPLDPQRRWFRYHPLLRDLLLRELEDTRHDTAALRRRAAAWHEWQGRRADAIELAVQAGDDPLAARLILASLPVAYREGRGTAVIGSIEALDTRAHREPSLGVSAGLLAALEGDPLAAARWAAVARDAASPEGASAPTPGVRRRDADFPLLGAVLCADGPDAMLADAELAIASHGVDWPWLPLALLASGAAAAMRGDAASAAERYLEAEQAPEAASDVIRLALRAERAIEAMDRKRWPEVQTILGLDRSTVLAHLDTAGIAASPWLVADARLAIHRGDLRTAKERLCQAEAGKRRLSWAIPWLAVRTLTELARGWLRLGHAPAAVADLQMAREILRVRPRLGRLAVAAEELWCLASRASTPELPGSSNLTRAELRLLPYLQTYLTLKEIGERLGVSGNTVKTEAVSIYGKLGAGSRSEAVTAAVTHGLLEDIFA